MERFYDYHIVRNYVKSDVDFIRKLCHRDKVSLDIGANRGQLTLFLLRYSSYVHCFEPVPELNKYLMRRFHKCNIAVEGCAIGNVNGILTLNIPVIGSRRILTRSSFVKDFNQEQVLGEKVSDIQKVLVQVRRLDDLHFHNIGFIKIDVEGFESQVLEGAWNTIMEFKPNMLVEIEQRHCMGSDMNSIIQRILEVGYYGYFMYNKKLCDINDFDLERMQNPSHENSENYVSNFAFSCSPLL